MKETCNFKGQNQVGKIEASANNTIFDCATLCNNTIDCKYYFFNTQKYCAMYSKCTSIKETSSMGSTFRKTIQGINRLRIAI